MYLNTLEMTMPTHLQTVEVVFPGTTEVVLGLERYPICPAKEWKTKRIVMHKRNGDSICWYKNGDASIRMDDGTYKYFWAKPTLMDFIHDRLHKTGEYFRIMKNGTVLNRIDGNIYYWGPTIKGFPHHGYYTIYCEDCLGNEEHCVCDSPCYHCGNLTCNGEDCWDNGYESW